MRRGILLRGYVLQGLFWLGLGIVWLRVAQLQTLEHGRLAAIAEDESRRSFTVNAHRGRILDREGRVLATSIEVPSVAANPSKVDDPQAVAAAMSAILDVPQSRLLARLRSERRFVWLRRWVSKDVAKKVQDLGLRSVFVAPETKRFYPHRELAAHAIGVSGADGHGLEGIELAADESLSGEAVQMRARRDALGQKLLWHGYDREELSERSGEAIQLTLDVSIQHAAEEALERATQRHQAKAGTLVVLDVATSELLAVANRPTMNPNTIANTSPGTRRNRVVTDVFEPGSTAKPLVIAAALSRGVIGVNQRFNCENGAMKLGGFVIRDTHPHESLILSDVVRYSSNICSAKIGAKLGKSKLRESLLAYGFGARAGAGMPGEVAGLLPSLKRWSPARTATASYGHGFAVTTLQLAAAYRVLAAGGVYLKPRIRRGQAAVEKRVLPESVAREVVSMMEGVVRDGGTGTLAHVPGYRVAGKTGTSEKIDPERGGYSDDRFSSVFAGFLPAEAPRVVIVVQIDEPSDLHSGGKVAAPVFAEVAGASMRLLGVPPTESISEPEATVETLVSAIPGVGSPPANATDELEELLRGKPVREALKILRTLLPHVEVQIEGTGRVQRVKSDADEARELVHLELGS